MNSAWRFLSAFLVLASVLFCGSFMTAQDPPPPELGAIQGTITRTGTNEPLIDARVTLQGGAADPAALQVLLSTAAAQGIVVNPQPGASTQQILEAMSAAAQARGFPLTTANLQSQLASLSGKAPPVTTTDRDGRYVFKDLQPGAYTVRVQRDGYFGAPEGGIYQPTAAADITVAPKETRMVDFAMVPGAILGGRIYDEKGQPMSNANVQVFTTAYAFGHAVIAPLVSKVTDDRGEYRLFWVPPGEYHLAVTPRPPAPQPGMPAVGAGVKTFYPGVSTIAEARVISLVGGEDLGGMDIGIRETRTFKISGQVSNLVPPPPLTLGATNPGVNAAVLMLVTQDANTPDDAGARTIATVPLLPSVGKFEAANIQPGSYELFARVSDPAAQVAGGLPLAWGRTSLEIRDTDVTDIPLTVSPSVDVIGTVSGAGGAKVPSGIRVQVLPSDGALKIPAYQLIFTRSATVSPDGAFRIPAVPPGRFRVSTVAGLPPDMYVADVRRNAQSVFDEGFDIGSKPPDALEVIVSTGAAAVEGIVQDGPVKVVPGATVVLVPEGRRRDNKALYIAAVSGADGRFALRGVAPGDYKLFAWESIPAMAFQNSGFLARYEDRGQRVQLATNGSARAVLSVIPAIERK